MDMNERVAARRAEIERRQRDEKAAVEDKKQAAHEADMSEIFEGLFGQAAADGTALKREGDGFALAEEPTLPADLATMKQTEIQRLLRSEARKSWTPKENWIAIGPMCAGVVALVLNPVIGFVILGFGLWRMTVANAKHEKTLVDQHPNLFATVKTRRSIRLF